MPVQNAPSSENLLLGKGQILFDRFDANGNSTGFRHLGNIDKFDLTTNDTKTQKYSAMESTAPLLKEIVTKRLVTLALTGSEFTPGNMALITQGDVSQLIQLATAVVAEPISDTTIPDLYYVTKKLGPISAVAVKFDAVAGVAGVDYEIVDANTGLIHILPGTILAGAVTVDYTPTAYDATNGPNVVSGGTAARVEGALKFIGDPTAGPAVIVDVWHVQVSPNGALSLISDDWADMSLNMEVLSDRANHPAAPLYQVTYLP